MRLWVALNGDSRRPVGDRPLLRLDLATGAVAQTVTWVGRLPTWRTISDERAERS